jgi:hypothetical protein
MIETPILITIIISSTAVIGYISRLLFYSKCDIIDCSCCPPKIHVHRITNDENKTIEGMNSN